MVRTQVQLSAELAEAVKRRAEAEKVSVAEIIRRALDGALTQGAPLDQARVRARAAAAAGTFGSGVAEISSRHDEFLAEAFEP
ncbi:MAG: CopG family transcriptional regulator [Proteobacteria bacterium]|nr:CopG family transcriptional regulator [Pseudomonadota bacterium]